MTTEPKTTSQISRRTWIVMIALAVTGQIAWAVENTWFNTFVFDTITPDPRPVSWMVAASAIIATITTIFIGTLSDRTRAKWGRRKPYILFGYVLWGVMTALFPTTALIKNISLAILMVVLLDCLMTFFGSTANDAAFNAWTADVAPADQRGRVEGVLSLSLFIAQLVAIVAAGALIDSVGYFTFFYVLGGIVMVVGLLAGGALPDQPSDNLPRSERGIWQEVRELFRVATLRENSKLFIILFSAMLLGVGFQVAFPYMIIYINNFIGVSKTEYAIVGGAVIIGSAIAAIPLGILADKINKRLMMASSIMLTCLGCFAFSFVRSIPLLALAGLVWQMFNMSASIAAMSWLKELLPAASRGRFLGIRMIFLVLLPMLIGPGIGSTLIQSFGIPTTLNGQAGFIPVPLIFQVGAVLGLLALIPLVFLPFDTMVYVTEEQDA
ncbi:MAG TPA: MFS transporter [Anaerolineaceae bacterium]|nr:MFS transporter [Anaerolineaceae bacterium]